MTKAAGALDLTCPTCGEVVAGDARFCEACGAELRAPTGDPSCPYCGAAASAADADGWCGQCGRRWSPERAHEERDDGPVAGVTDRGISHWRNEDAMALSTVDGPPTGMALVVADGVSTSREPQVVSAAAVDAALAVLSEALAGAEDEPLADAMTRAVAAAQVAAAGVPDDPASEPDIGPGACTFVAAAIRGDDAAVAWVGDSRAYWIDRDGATQLSTDDSWAAEQVAGGSLTPAEALASPAGHAITKWLGSDSEDPTPAVAARHLAGPGIMLLASDGLWNYAPDDESIGALIGEVGREPPLALARRLVQFALDEGGADNIAVVAGYHRIPEAQESQ